MFFSGLVWKLAGLLGAVLQILLIGILLKGPYRKYPVLFLYVIIAFLINVVESAEYWKLIEWSAFGVRLYWTNEMIFQVLVFATVISLIYRASIDSSARTVTARMLILGAFVVMGLSIILPYSAVSFNRWMTGATRNLSFASAILNLLLWGRLVAQKGRDPELLMISGAFGLQTAGKAIGHSLRVLGLNWLGNPIIPITYLLSLLILWRGFRRRLETVQPRVP